LSPAAYGVFLLQAATPLQSPPDGDTLTWLLVGAAEDVAFADVGVVLAAVKVEVAFVLLGIGVDETWVEVLEGVCVEVGEGVLKEDEEVG